MASYSFSDPTSTLVGPSLNSAINTSSSGVVSNTGGEAAADDAPNNIGSYAAPQVYRRDSAMANYEYVAQQQQQKPQQQVDDTVPTSFSGTIDAHHMSRGILADYFLKNQTMPANTEQTPTGTTELNQASSGAVVSPPTEPVYPYYQGQHQHQQQQQPSTTSSCMVDPLPSFLSSLPLPNAATGTTKYAAAAATTTTATDEARTSGGGGTDNNADPNNSILAAAAAAAAATVVATNTSTTNVAAAAATNNSYTDMSSYSHTPTNGYGYGYSGNTPSMANQVVSGLQSVNNPLDLNSYSVSSLSKPLSNQPSSTAMLLMGNGENANHTGDQSSNDSGNVFSVLSLPQPPSTVASGAGGGVVAQRSYSDYTTYYRTPSNTFGLGGGATATNNAAAAAATGYYPGTAAAYQPYMRPAANPAHAYYYAAAAQHGGSRYLPYNAYPPIRHFVSPARPFKCETCDQSFSRNHDLKRHVKIHSGIKPHKCPKCGKSFGRSDALKRHSMVKRCRSLNTSQPTSSTAATAVVSQQQPQPQPPQTVASQRLDTNAMRMPPPPPPPPISSQYSQYSSQQQPTADMLIQGSMATTNNDNSSRMFVPPSSSNSIVSGMLSSRTNAI